MSKEPETLKVLIDQLSDAHQQLIERDQRIADLSRENVALSRENVALRTHLESVLATRAWRASEHFRRIRSTLLRRPN